MLIKKRENTADCVENIFIELYTKEICNSDIEQKIYEMYNFNISTAAISRITDKITGGIIAWNYKP
jgi:putative transposase